MFISPKERKIEERILDSYFSDSKVNPLFAYE